MMFREKSISKFYAFTLAAVFALTLAGCGGGSAMMDTGEEMPPVMVDPEPTPEEIAAQEEMDALTAAQEGAMTAATAAMAAVYGAVDPVAMANAKMNADMAKGASDAAAMAETSAMAGEYQMKAEMYRDMAMEAGMERSLGITKTANAAANQSAINSAALTGMPAPPPISNAGRVGKAMAGAAVAKAKGANSDGVTKPAEKETTNQGGVVTVTVADKGSGPRFTVARTLLTADDKPGVKPGRGEVPSSLMMRGGWAGTELVGSAPTAATGYKENAVIFTDIKPPVQSYDSTSRTTIGADNTKHFTAKELSIPVNETGSLLNKAVITGDVPGDGSHFAATFNTNPTDNAPAASGRFFCPTKSSCSISVDASGVLRAIQGYEFQPNIAGSVLKQDSDYLSWGLWLYVPNRVPAADDTDTDDDESAPATVAAFASGNNLFEVKAALTGMATYNGVATGLYSAAGMVEYFEADASLTADFGGRGANDSTPATAGSDSGLYGAVTGMISNIKAGGMDVDGSLTLGRAPLIAGDDPVTIAASVKDDDPARSFNGNTAGTLGSSAVSGSWTGRFYGPNKAASGSVAVRTEFPTTAAGTFGAATPKGVPAVRILGAFGSWKAE